MHVGVLYFLIYIYIFSDELCASIVRSHRETSQYRVEELQALRWKVFNREEIQTYQSKVYQPDGCFFWFSGILLYLCNVSQTVSKQNMPFQMT